MLTDYNSEYCEIIILTRNSKIGCSPHQNFMSFSQKKNILKCIQKHGTLWIIKAVLSKKEKEKTKQNANVKLYHRAIVTKNISLAQNQPHKQMEHYEPRVNLCYYSYLIYKKNAPPPKKTKKTKPCWRNVHFQQKVLPILHAHM